jgi:hypothetical protein
MIDPTEYEREAIAYSGNAAGEYLDAVGETDIAKLDVDQWDDFIEVIITAYVQRLGEISDNLSAAAARMKNKVTAADIPY